VNTRNISRFAMVLSIGLVAAFVAIVLFQPAPVSADDGFQVMPPDGRYQGKTYEKWAKKWHKWILEVPADVNPMLDETGANCAEGQQGVVWFLTGALGDRTVNRACTVPEGKALFFPVQNAMWFPFPNDPPLSDEDKRNMEAGYHDWVAGAEGSATIDDVEIEDLGQYQFNTGWFDAYMPDDNLIDYLYGESYIGPDWPDGWPAGDSGPHFNDGIYLLMTGLEPGEHTVNFTGWNGGLDVTYALEVAQ
jgi:hypothetical protein